MSKVIISKSIVILIVFCFCFSSCEDEVLYTPPTLPTVTTLPITNYQGGTPTGGTIVSNGGSNVYRSGVCWSTSVNPTVNSNKVISSVYSGTFNVVINYLTPGLTYYIRAYAQNYVGIAYGNQIVFTVPFHYHGEFYAGGYVFSIDASGNHGMVVTTGNINFSADWGCQGTSIAGAINQSVGSGQANTTAIVNGCALTTNAAPICNNYVISGYNDWYLPSSLEFDLIYNNLVNTSVHLPNYNNYWTSTEVSATHANSKFLGSGTNYTTSSTLKTSLCGVRAIRNF